MKKILYLFLALLAGQTVVAQNVKKDSAALKTISNYILSNYDCYNDLRDLCKQIGHRISGSPQAEQAVLWGKKVLEQTGCDKVYLQEVMVPHWVRGEEQGMIINKKGMRSSIEISS